MTSGPACGWSPLAGQCANSGLAGVKRDMPSVLHQLRSAAGPYVSFVGLTYADPFLARYVKPAGPVPAAHPETDVRPPAQLRVDVRVRRGEDPRREGAGGLRIIGHHHDDTEALRVGAR